VTDLHVVASGDPGADPVVLVHGSFGWGTQTFPAVGPLARTHRLLVVDRRGFGESPAVQGATGWPLDTDDLVALLAEVGPAHLVGHSYGGVVSLLAAGRRPDLVRSVVAIEPPAFGLSDDPAAVALTASLSELRRRADELTTADYAREFFRTLLRMPGDEIARWTATWDARAWAAAEASRREAPPMHAPIDLDALAALTVPLVLACGGWPESMAGAAHPSGEAFRAVAETLSRRTGAELAVFEHSMHNPQLTEPKALNTLLRRTWSAPPPARA
jgi:pimeloyl-ACP methyl ester carboxylesterase